MRALTIRQPWADLIMFGGKDVENRSWPVPSTLPQCYACTECDHRIRQSLPHLTPNAHYAHDPSGIGGVWHKLEPDGPFPFTIAVHAGLQVDRDAAWSIREAVDWANYLAITPARRDEFDRKNLGERLGAILGTVDVTGCHDWGECWSYSVSWDDGTSRDEGCSRWAERPEDFDLTPPYHWTLANPRPIVDPIPAKGMLGLWTLNDRQIEAIFRQEINP